MSVLAVPILGLVEVTVGTSMCATLACHGIETIGTSVAQQASHLRTEARRREPTDAQLEVGSKQSGKLFFLASRVEEHLGMTNASIVTHIIGM